jgi:hypothetical protein
MTPEDTRSIVSMIILGILIAGMIWRIAKPIKRGRK